MGSSESPLIRIEDNEPAGIVLRDIVLDQFLAVHNSGACMAKFVNWNNPSL